MCLLNHLKRANVPPQMHHAPTSCHTSIWSFATMESPAAPTAPHNSFTPCDAMIPLVSLWGGMWCGV